MRLPLLSALILMLAFGGCASTPILDSALLAKKQTFHKPREPKVRDQLVLHTDFDLPAEHRMVTELVAEREQIGARLGLPPGREPIHVYLFADETSYRECVSQRFPNFPQRRAIFVETDSQLSVYAHWGDHVAEDLRHETAHGYLHAAVPNLPLWLDEGLAEYFEVGRGKKGFNKPHVELLRTQRDAGCWKPDLARLEKLASAEAMTQLDYAESWLWVHWLLDGADAPSEVLPTALTDLGKTDPGPLLGARLASATPNAETRVADHLAQLVAEAESSQP